MSRYVLFASLFALACAEDPDALPADQLAPSAGYDLDLYVSPLAHGEVASLEVVGIPNREVHFVLGQRGLGSSACPPFLTGACPEMRSPMQVLSSVMADANGIAHFDVTLPTTVPENCFGLQAFTLGGVPARSPAIERCVSAVPEPCHEDAFAGSTSIATAAFTPVGTNRTALRACPEAPDYFAVDLDVGDILDVDAIFSHADGDVDLALLAPSGFQLVTSVSADDNESVLYEAPVPGTYYIKVDLFAGVQGQPGATYALDTSLRPARAACIPDNFEDNDILVDATPWPANQSVSNLTSCPNDLDVYEVSLNAGQTLDIDVLFTDSQGDIDLTILSSGGIPLDNAASSSDNESLSFTAPSSDVYYIQVNFFGNDDLQQAGNTYQLISSL